MLEIHSLNQSVYSFQHKKFGKVGVGDIKFVYILKAIIMKTTAKKIKGILVILVFVMLTINETKAQPPYPLYNNAPCDVIIAYEVWDAVCVVCQWGQIPVKGNGGSVNLPLCSGWTDICIVILDIGGDVAPSNHSVATGNCHAITPFGQTGVTSTTATCPVYSWNAVQTINDWTFN
jgi:hypothetical protein